MGAPTRTAVWDAWPSGRGRPAFAGPWAKIADEIQLWRRTVLTTFSVNTDLRHLAAVANLNRA